MKFIKRIKFVFKFWKFPDFLSIFGFTDDIVVTSFVLQQMVKMAPESLKEKYKVLEE
jgi:uncharacterized membrane protein YkvA (DUF1232 family)